MRKFCVWAKTGINYDDPAICYTMEKQPSIRDIAGWFKDGFIIAGSEIIPINRIVRMGNEEIEEN